MKFVKWFIILVAALLGLFIVITFFLPTDYHVERSVEVAAPADLVYGQVANLVAWQRWNPWNEMDPGMALTYGETVTGVGAWYSWESDVAGNGKMTVIEAAPPMMVRFELIFDGYESLPSYSSMIVSPLEGTDEVRVTWTFEGSVGDQLFARWMTVMIDKFVGKSYQQGLDSLRDRCEGIHKGDIPWPEPLPSLDEPEA